MKLPNAENAVVPEAKITRYLLDPLGKGKDKAEFFSSNGFSLEEWETLRDALFVHAAENEVVEEVLTETGTIYIIEGSIISPTASSLFIRSVWQIDFWRRIPQTHNRVCAGGKATKMAQIIPEHEIAILTVDLPEFGLCAGKRGVVVDVQGEGEAYIVEFFTPEGDTIDVVYVHADQIRRPTVEEAAQSAVDATERNPYPQSRIPSGTHVELLIPQPEYGLRAGQIGEVLADFHSGYYYAVGFTTGGGVYIERPGIPYDQLRPVTKAETEAQRSHELPARASCGCEVPARATK